MYWINIEKIGYISKISDFFDFFEKIMIFSIPAAATDAVVGDQSVSETTRNEEPETQNGTKKNGGGGYEGLDPREVEAARLRAQRPSEYAGLQRDNLEDLYSRPKKKR